MGHRKKFTCKRELGSSEFVGNICVLFRYRTYCFILMQALATHVFNCEAISSLFAFISKYPSESTSPHNKPIGSPACSEKPLSTINVQTVNNCSFTLAVAKLRNYLVVVKRSTQKTV